MTTLALESALDPDRIPIGIDAYGDWLELLFSGIENPHILIAGGSQTGKTTLQILIAAVAASRGNIVIIIDPKLRFARPFRHPVTGEPLPNVLVYQHEKPDVLAREAQGALELVVAEEQRRYRLDSESPVGILKDHTRFPTILVVIDELGNLLDFADGEWPKRRPDGYKGDTPIRELLRTLTRMGAEARALGCFANQTANADEMPAGTKTRRLCGQRVFLGSIRERTDFRMLAGDDVPIPDIPDGQKGAGALICADRNPRRFQVGYLNTADRAEDAYNLAVQGVSILREGGHIDEQGRLILAGVPVPRPGIMASHVAGPHIDLLHDEDLPVVVNDDEDEDQTETVIAAQRDHGATVEVPESATEMIVGNPSGAEFCGLSLANFRKKREQNPITGEVPNYQGNKPAWPEVELREWKLRYVDDRKRGAA